MAYTNALTIPDQPSGSVLVYWGPGHYVNWRYQAPDSYSDKQWRDRSARVYRNHIKHRKGLLARFRKQRVPAACRTFAEYQEKHLTLEIAFLEGRDTIPLYEALDLQRERFEAGRMAREEMERLREQYKGALSASAELKALKSAENELLDKRKWRF
jgi:hypothetical protein